MHAPSSIPSLCAALLVCFPTTAPAADTSDTQIIESILVIGHHEDPFHLPGAATIVSAETLQQAAFTDVHKLTSEVPGLYIRTEDGYGLRPNIGLRGTDSDRSGRITLLEDGVPIAPAPYSSPSAYYFPTMGRISSVEVLKGPAAITTGPLTTGGAINLMSTPIPQQQTLVLRQELGENNRMRTHSNIGATTLDGFGWLVEMHRDVSDGFAEANNSSTGFNKRDLMVKLRYDYDGYTASHQVSFKYLAASESSNQTYVGLTDTDFKHNPHQRYALTQLDNIAWDQTTLSLGYRLSLDLHSPMEISTTLFQTSFERDWYKVDKIGIGTDPAGDIATLIALANTGNTDAIEVLHGQHAANVQLKHNARAYQTDGIITRLHWQHNSHNLTLGVRVLNDEEDRFQYRDDYQQDTQGLLSSTGNSIAPSNSDNRITDTSATSVMASYQVNIGDWSLTPGLRRESYRTRQIRYSDVNRTAMIAGYPSTLSSESRTLLGLGTTWVYNSNLVYFTGLHQGFAPSNDPAIDPEKSVSRELGMRYRDGATRMEATLFTTDYDNLLGECKNSSGGNCAVGQVFSGGKSKVQGVELLGHWQPESLSYEWPITLTFTLTRAYFKENFASDFDAWGTVKSGDQLPNLPEHQLSVNAAMVSTDRWRLQTRLSAFSGTCSTTLCTDNTRISAWSQIDVTGHWLYSEQWHFYGQLENLFDNADVVARHPKNGARAQKPRTLLLGLLYRLHN